MKNVAPLLNHRHFVVAEEKNTQYKVKTENRQVIIRNHNINISLVGTLPEKEAFFMHLQHLFLYTTEHWTLTNSHGREIDTFHK